MKFQAYCPYCQRKVTTYTALAGNELKLALDSNGDVQVRHLTNARDHQWNLNNHEKENLRNKIAFEELSIGASS
jgi:chromosome condensin MukBEF ATPase and DNA-binding subunit MukB